MTVGPGEPQILWHCTRLASAEHASLLEGEDGATLQGVVVVPVGDEAGHIEHVVVVDRQWRACTARATVTTPSGRRKIVLRSVPVGGWDLDGAPAPHLAHCSDIDLGWTPATNTIPIRRLALEIGQTAGITAAWIRFPELDVVPNDQLYTRLATDRWRYWSGDFDFELTTDPASGLVLTYGDDLWRASAISLG